MLKAVVSDLSTVDEAHKGFYIEKEGKFILNVSPSDGYALENITPLKNSLIAARNERDGYKTQLTAFEGLDVAAAKSAIAKVAEFGDIDINRAREGLTAADKFSKFDPEKEADKIAEEKLKNAKTQLKADFEAQKLALTTELTSKDNALKSRDAQVRKLLKRDAITTELTKLKPLDEARDVLEMLADVSVQFKEVNGEYVPVVVDADGNPRTKIDGSYNSVPVTVAEFMSELKEKRPSFFASDDKTGLDITAGKSQPGAVPGGTPNPWKTETRNLTQQALLTKNNPTLAARFKAEAGF